MKPPTDRLAHADSAFVEAELRARERGEEFPPPLAHADDRTAACPACGARRDGADAASATRLLSVGELDALHFRFWSDDHKRFDHIGFARAVIAAHARAAAATCQG